MKLSPQWFPPKLDHSRWDGRVRSARKSPGAFLVRDGGDVVYVGKSGKALGVAVERALSRLALRDPRVALFPCATAGEADEAHARLERRWTRRTTRAPAPVAEDQPEPEPEEPAAEAAPSEEPDEDNQEPARRGLVSRALAWALDD